MHRGKLLTNKLLTQEYCKPRLVKTIKKFYGRHHEIVDKGLNMVRQDTGPIFLPSLNYAVDQIYTSFYFQEYTNYGIMRVQFTTVCIFVLKLPSKLVLFIKNGLLR